MLGNLAIVGFKFNHHGKYSGYHQIVHYLNPFLYLDRDKFDFTFPLLNFKGGSFINQFLKKVGDKMFFDELYKICHNPDIRIIHFLYPENTLALCPFEIPHDKLVIGTFHQPNEYFLEQFKNNNGLAIKNYSRCDRAILLIYDQINVFKSITEIKSVHFIPHGIDTIRFKPTNIKRKDNHILFLGNWLRDFECAAGVFQVLNRINKNIKVTVVCNKENHKYFLGIPNVQCYHNVSDDYLLHLLQTYTLLFLPLKNSTANNALIEAAACGLPILTTDLKSVSNYLELLNFMKFPLSMHKDHKSLANKILLILNTYEDNLHLSNNLTECVSNYSWHVIAKRTIEVYQLNKLFIE